MAPNLIARLLMAVTLAFLSMSLLAADVMPMPYQVGKGHADPTRPGITVPSVSDYIRQLHANKDERARTLGDGLCDARFAQGDKPAADAPIVDFWQENKDLVVLLPASREYRLQCDWIAGPDTRETAAAPAFPVCRTRKTKAVNGGQAAYWNCRHCPPAGCSAP